MVEKYMAEHPLCERCLQAPSMDPHERIPRSQGGSIVDPENLIGLCRYCHRWVHAHPRQATEDGWLESGKKPFSFRS